MKIYNKKKFADGCFFLVLGAALAGAIIWKREIDGKSVVLALIALVIGADALVRSLSRRLSYQDKVEALDERNIQVELRARSRTLSLLRGTLMAGADPQPDRRPGQPEGRAGVRRDDGRIPACCTPSPCSLSWHAASIMKAGYRDRITEDPDEKESEEFHMSHTREEEWKQVRALHLVRDERDREVGAAAKGRAGDAVLAASQLFAAVCLLRGDPAWAAFLSLTFVGGRGACLHRFLGG